MYLKFRQASDYSLIIVVPYTAWRFPEDITYYSPSLQPSLQPSNRSLTSLKCWRQNDRGECGAGSTDNNVLTPVLVDLRTNRYAMSITVGDAANCTVIDNESVNCIGWDTNLNGELGIGNTDTAYMTRTTVAVELGRGNSAQRIFSTTNHFFAILRGNAGCWCEVLWT